MGRKMIPGKAEFLERVRKRKEEKANEPKRELNEEVEKKPLFLVMQKVYFDEILRGDKLVEYRDDTPYYRSRFFTADGKFRNYQTVILQVGYHAGARRMTMEVKEIYFDDQFQISLGEILERNF